ncbi:Maf family protein [Neisseria leonii]|uniref:dTTP/UTP pyrophosphatase n=1 Tax=Neisseria leonii TaxID=2995413 RepID=A0A9X4E182_9NEIS|nr:Maf family protein [Neisseria sp. 51.81]MDD9327621.1 Maf family nucleotide pyrophosphatase [Neisseria sp. 51.81]
MPADRPTLCLASASPRRREILESLGFLIERTAADIDETPRPDETAAAYVCRMAREKNAAAYARYQTGLPLLTADTCVALNGKILGKPQHPAEAHEMLTALSGTVHQVHTAVHLHHQGRAYHVLHTSHVRFRTLAEDEIARYIRSGEPLDKAGAYGIQGAAGVWVSSLDGSFTGVMGLPVFETCQLLAEAGIAVPPFAD